MGTERSGPVLKYSKVHIPSTFPISRRPIYITPAATVSHKTKEESYNKVAKAVDRVTAKRPLQRILVHTVSYELAKVVREHTDSHRTIVYGSASKRQRAISDYRLSTAGILVASSLDRGIDLPGEACRVIIVCKVPYPNLGDKQISARCHSPKGQTWYNIQTIRSIVQMTGRGMRSEDDYCESYILDGAFIPFYKRNKHLFPSWWSQALRWDISLDTIEECHANQNNL